MRSLALTPMWWLLRHLLAIAVLPFTVTVLIPRWIARREGTALRLGDAPVELALQLAGAAVLAAGLLLFGASLHRRLAPWSPEGT